MTRLEGQDLLTEMNVEVGGLQPLLLHVRRRLKGLRHMLRSSTGSLSEVGRSGLAEHDEPSNVSSLTAWSKL